MMCLIGDVQRHWIREFLLSCAFVGFVTVSIAIVSKWEIIESRFGLIPVTVSSSLFTYRRTYARGLVHRGALRGSRTSCGLATRIAIFGEPVHVLLHNLY